MSAVLASYAVHEEGSRGRSFDEPPHPYRNDFERDRDRIIHCSAFRRLEGKTQVFMPGLDDYYRTRLTHSIEVAQIGRTIAKALALNESLTEAICLAHDLGHSPFSHSGEQVLNELMSDYGGFEHNQQTLRVVDLLEHPYPGFAGLNLMYETRLGLAKHRGPFDNPAGDNFRQFNCSLEGQVAGLADRIAYNCHDVEDAMRAGLIEQNILKNLELFAEAQKKIDAFAIDDAGIRRTRTAKGIIDNLVSDCIQASTEAIAKAKIKDVKDVYERPESLIVLSERRSRELVQFEKFLLDNVYMHKTLRETMAKVSTWLTKIFDLFVDSPNMMPGRFQKLIETEGLYRTVCDYLAGMTDRFCLKILEDL